MKSSFMELIWRAHLGSSFWQGSFGELHLKSSFWKAPFGELLLESPFWRAPFGELPMKSSLWRAPFRELILESSFWGAPFGELLLETSFWRPLFWKADILEKEINQTIPRKIELANSSYNSQTMLLITSFKSWATIEIIVIMVSWHD